MNVHAVSGRVYDLFLKSLQARLQAGETLPDIVHQPDPAWRQRLLQQIEKILWEEA